VQLKTAKNSLFGTPSTEAFITCWKFRNEYAKSEEPIYLFDFNVFFGVGSGFGEDFVKGNAYRKIKANLRRWT
jgi:hypothetical protein